MVHSHRGGEWARSRPEAAPRSLLSFLVFPWVWKRAGFLSNYPRFIPVFFFPGGACARPLSSLFPGFSRASAPPLSALSPGFPRLCPSPSMVGIWVLAAHTLSLEKLSFLSSWMFCSIWWKDVCYSLHGMDVKLVFSHLIRYLVPLSAFVNISLTAYSNTSIWKPECENYVTQRIYF